MTTVNLPKKTLGPRFSTHTKETFLAHVTSLKLERSLGRVKLPKAPRVKKEKLSHSVTDGLCSRCGKKPRKPEALCSGKKAAPQSVVAPAPTTPQAP